MHNLQKLFCPCCYASAACTWCSRSRYLHRIARVFAATITAVPVITPPAAAAATTTVTAASTIIIAILHVIIVAVRASGTTACRPNVVYHDDGKIRRQEADAFAAQR